MTRLMKIVNLVLLTKGCSFPSRLTELQYILIQDFLPRVKLGNLLPLSLQVKHNGMISRFYWYWCGQRRRRKAAKSVKLHGLQFFAILKLAESLAALEMYLWSNI